MNNAYTFALNKYEYFLSLLIVVVLNFSFTQEARGVIRLETSIDFNYSSIPILSSKNTFQNLPDGTYVLTNKDRDENGSFLVIFKKGDFFIADGIVDIDFVTQRAFNEWTCATGSIKDNRLIFNDLIGIEIINGIIGRDLQDIKIGFIKDIPVSEINTENFLTEIESYGMWNSRNDNQIGLCSNILPRISNRVRVVDSKTGQSWNLSNVLPESNVKVIALDAPDGEPVLEMPITTGEKNVDLNGRFSSRRVTKGDEKNLVPNRQYFLRATLFYWDNINIGNTHQFLGNAEGCAAPSNGKIKREVVRDSKPFTVVNKADLYTLIHFPEKLGKIEPWGMRTDTSTSAGKAVFDKNVLEYRKNVDEELKRRISQIKNLDFPPPLILIHGILSCHDKWNEWINNLSNAPNNRNNSGYPKNGTITFTPNYDYWVKNRWTNIQELKNLRDTMASDLSKQIALNINSLILFNDNQLPISINIVAHSNGGIVARPLSKIKSSQWQIKNIFTLGSPHSGTLAPFGEDFGLSLDQMLKYNCIEGGFNSKMPVMAFAGSAYSDWLVSPGKTNSLQSWVKSFQVITGNEKFNDGAVYPHASTFNIVCGNSSSNLSLSQQLNLIKVAPLYHSPSFPIIFKGNKGNFLDSAGLNIFKLYINPKLENN